MKKFLIHFGAVLLLVFVSGCGGSKVLKEPEPLVLTHSLAAASDERLSATLDWVIVRDGPGTWAKNVDWDEYLIRVHNLSGDSLQVTKIIVMDSLGTHVETGESRSQLVKATKKTKRRYKGEGLTVKAGAGVATLMAGGTALAIGSVAVGWGATGALAGVAVGAFALAPVIAVGGIFRGVNNHKVNNQVETRQTLLPVVVTKDEEKGLDVFFPLTPSPRQIEFAYTDSQGSHTLIVDTRVALEGLHLVQDEE